MKKLKKKIAFAALTLALAMLLPVSPVTVAQASSGIPDGAETTMSLLLDGDIGLRFQVAAGDALKNGHAEMSIAGKTPREENTDLGVGDGGKYVCTFTVNAIQMAEKVTAAFYDAGGSKYTEVSRSVEDYYELVKEQSDKKNEEELVKALVNYGYYAQQALHTTGNRPSAMQAEPTTVKADLAAYYPVITGSSSHVTGLSLSLMLDNKTTLCLYFSTNDQQMPHVTVDGSTELTPITYGEEAAAFTGEGIPENVEKMPDGRWLVRITNVDALHLSEVHEITADGRTVYLSALSYGSITQDNDNAKAICALHDYYLAALRYTDRRAITFAAAEQTEYEYTGSVIMPALTVKSEGTVLDSSQYTVVWDGNRIDAGTYTGTVIGTNGLLIGAQTVSFTITPKKLESPVAKTGLVYNGNAQTGVNGGEKYSVMGNTAVDAGNYSATVTIIDGKNYCWADGTEGSKTIPWSIAKATPTKNGGILITYYPISGEKDVAGGMNVRGSFNFSAPPTADGAYTVTFVPEDTVNYETVSVQVNVMLHEVIVTPEIPIA